MIRFLAIRGAQSVLVLLVMSFIIYGLMGLMPGDPVDLMITADPKITAEDAARLRAIYGLDQPILERYGHWLAAAVQGDFGYSRLYSEPVLSVLGPALWNTLKLLGISLIASLLIAIPVGVWAARKPYGKIDYAVNFACFAGISIPPFWLGLMLIIVFAVILGWLPAGGSGAVGGTGTAGGLGNWIYLILPVANLTLASVGGHTRYVRASMMEVLRQDYIRTARAMGLGEKRVIWRHALPNALMPVVTILALDLGFLVSGALITETIFAYPGMGKLIYDSVLGNDYNLALVALLFATLLTLVGNLLADLAYAWLDPRVTFDAGGSS